MSKKPKAPIIVEGFPGLGFVATIAVEYLIEHLGAKSIGRIWSPEIQPMAAFHKSKMHRPLEIFYASKKNILLIHALAPLTGFEWKLADAVLVLAQQLKAKEVISLEGVGSPFGASLKFDSFYHTNNAKAEKKFKKIGLKALSEGVIVGVSGALMLRTIKKIPTSFIFAETTSKLPDSRAAAELVKILDDYLKLGVDHKPLIRKAAEVEKKLKDIMKQGQETSKLKKKKELSYVG